MGSGGIQCFFKPLAITGGAWYRALWLASSLYAGVTVYKICHLRDNGALGGVYPPSLTVSFMNIYPSFLTISFMNAYQSCRYYSCQSVDQTACIIAVYIRSFQWVWGIIRVALFVLYFPCLPMILLLYISSLLVCVKPVCQGGCLSMYNQMPPLTVIELPMLFGFALCGQTFVSSCV